MENSDRAAVNAERLKPDIGNVDRLEGATV